MATIGRPGKPISSRPPRRCWRQRRGFSFAAIMRRCDRSGPGYLRLIGPLSFAANCVGHLAPYRVPLGDFALMVMDSADADDLHVDPAHVPVYQAELADAVSPSPLPVWLTMHRPIWAAMTGPLNVPVGGNAPDDRGGGKNHDHQARYPDAVRAISIPLKRSIIPATAPTARRRPRSWRAMAATCCISPPPISKARRSRAIPASASKTACRWAASAFCC